MSRWGHSRCWSLSQQALGHMVGIHSRHAASPSQDTHDPSHTQQQPITVSNQPNVRINTKRAGADPRTFLQDGSVNS